jgi:hypothetical protein
MSDDEYESDLLERIQSLTAVELETLLAFFDCVAARPPSMRETPVAC